MQVLVPILLNVFRLIGSHLPKFFKQTGKSPADGNCSSLRLVIKTYNLWFYDLVVPTKDVKNIVSYQRHFWNRRSPLLKQIFNSKYFLSFSFDVRGRAFNKALFWSDTNSFGPRAYFVTVSRPAALSVENVALEDGGVSYQPFSSSNSKKY